MQPLVVRCSHTQQVVLTAAAAAGCWLQVQKAWMYLEPIFSSSDLPKQLPTESKAFDLVHKQLRDIMRRTKDRPNALQTASNPGGVGRATCL